MSNAEIYNIVVLIGTVLAIAFGVWLNRQTRKVEQDIARLARADNRHRQALRASRR